MKKSYSKIGDFEISGRFTIPSGIVTTTPPVMLKFARECEALGIITSKSIGPEPRKGNPSPIISQETEYMILNAVGLSNPGIDTYVSEMREIREVWPENKFLLTSVFGKDKDEFVYVATKAADVSDGIELNFGCPHSGGLAQIGRSPELVEEITAAVIESVNIPVLPKLTPSAYDIAAVAKAAENAGASGIVAINTVGPGYTSNLSNRVGGMSGPAIKTIGLRCVREIANSVDLPVIGMGGISTLEDITEYQNAGADFFGIGSALIGMSSEETTSYFNKLSKGLDSPLTWAKKNKKIKTYDLKEAKIISVKKVADNLNIISFDYSAETLKPGQFMMLHPKDGEAKPFSIADNHPITFAVRTVGENSSRINSLEKGDTINISGPYGKNIPTAELFSEKVVLVGGGTGIAPINFFAKHLSKFDITLVSYLGARTREEIIFSEEIKKNSRIIHISTDDGSFGKCGFVTESLESNLSEKNHDDAVFINCGPELMLKKAVEIQKKYSTNPRIFCGIERYTKCGIGLCGACEINGYRACVDGPFFEFSQVENELGSYKRDATGARVVA